MDTLRQDPRFAARALFKSPALAVIAVMCMALGIAANVFVYSPLNSLLIRPLPYRDSQRLVHVNTWRTTEAREGFAGWSWLDFHDVAAGLGDVFVETGAYRGGWWNVGGMDEPARVNGSRVTASLFPMLGLRPALGRSFSIDEERARRVVVLGHGLWQRRFGADSAILGRGVTLNGAPYTVIGVMQEKVQFPETDEFWLPSEPTAAQTEQRDGRAFQFIARLRPGVSEATANLRVAAFMKTLAERYPDTSKNYSAWLHQLSEDVRSEVRAIFLTMVGAVAFVLLIACSSVANLLLARGSARQRELAVRLSLGATRPRMRVECCPGPLPGRSVQRSASSPQELVVLTGKWPVGA